MSIKIPSKNSLESKEETMEILLARSLFYQVLSFLYRHPSSIRNCLMFKKDIPMLLRAMETFPFLQKNFLRETLKKIKRVLEEITYEEWKYHYEYCFGHTAHGSVPAYELEYGEEHNFRQPQELGDIAAFYHAFGLLVNKNVHERVDHVSVECEFMHYLLFKEVYAIEHDDEQKILVVRNASRRFLSQHLGRWLPSFSRRLSRYLGEGLMKYVADFSFDFIVQDCQWMKVDVGPEDLAIRSVQQQEPGCASCMINSKMWGT